MKSRILILTILLVSASSILLFQACNSEASVNVKGTLIKGTFANSENLQLFFDRINYDQSNNVIAKVEIDNKGKFQLPFEDGIEKGIYRIRIGAKKAFFIFDGSEKTIALSGDLTTFEEYDFTLEGSTSGEEFCNLMKKLASGTIDKNGIVDFVKSSSNPLLASFIMYITFTNTFDQLPLANEVAAKFVAAEPNSKYAKDYKKIVEQQQAQYLSIQARQKIKVGLPAPEINLNTPDGKEYALSDLKGKVVLLDFWASWCGPCRKANPHVVEIYNKYKNKGFTVYSVSLDGINPRLKNRFKTEEQLTKQLDKAKERWIAAIEKDGLKWDAHVSDLQHWNSIAAKTYGVSSIPKTFLIDRDGTIAAIDPRYNLEEALLKVL